MALGKVDLGTQQNYPSFCEGAAPWKVACALMRLELEGGRKKVEWDAWERPDRSGTS